MDAINFGVAYRYGEYRQFVLAHVRQGGFKVGFLSRMFFSLVAAFAFRVKVHRVGACVFTIDDTGIRRRAKDGEVTMPWRDVIAVHRYAPGYLIDKGKGAFPIPYRCLDPAQKERLEALIAAYTPRR